ncbi:acyl-CoA dehydrogenase family protein [Novosphingobium sp. KCTC 2891]|uniref:acyl-CoA dehydrogenase family protein n=1 Tax=Novosphingobium sp. KCTC 2891 TaxID=2989730 RepID=UPI0022235C16|nr:acyl-CoA dehydrogenase family protein [Novosphingobium sp. KCTC 2891]MCW1383620.1 acyl-CoA dehydrogenase family protein [Novosphingobium sp. KCTC 2891]
MSDDDNILTETFRRVLGDVVTSERIRAFEDSPALAPIWPELAETGFLDALVGEEYGGAGLSLAQVFPLVLALGEHATPVPFAETMLARAWLAPHGISLPDDAAVVLAPRSAILPFAEVATHALVADRDMIRVVEVTSGSNDVFRAGGALTLNPGRELGAFAGTPGDLLLAAAALTSGQMVGAMARMLDMTLNYAGERQQFGRSLGKFQAIQQQLAVMAEQVISAQVAARTALRSTHFEPIRVAAAKCRANEAARLVCNIAHAVHGAIGATAEFDLQLFSRRVKQGQVAFGSERYWAVELGRARVTADCQTTADFLRLHLMDEDV